MMHDRISCYIRFPDKAWISKYVAVCTEKNNWIRLALFVYNGHYVWMRILRPGFYSQWKHCETLRNKESCPKIISR